MLKTLLYYTSDFVLIATIAGAFILSGTLFFWIALLVALD
jgi:hypothetical protein